MNIPFGPFHLAAVLRYPISFDIASSGLLKAGPRGAVYGLGFYLHLLTGRITNASMVLGNGAESKAGNEFLYDDRHASRMPF
jgi:hypothetical protein